MFPVFHLILDAVVPTVTRSIVPGLLMAVLAVAVVAIAFAFLLKAMYRREHKNDDAAAAGQQPEEAPEKSKEEP